MTSKSKSEIDREVALLTEKVQRQVDSGVGDDALILQIQAVLEDLHTHQEELRAQSEELVAAKERSEKFARRYEALFDLAPVGYLLISSDNETIRKANKVAARLLGYASSDAMCGRTVYALVNAHDMSSFRQHLLRVFATIGTTVQELTLKDRDGVPVPVEMHSQLVVDPESRETLCLTVMFDLTERKKSETALRDAMQEAHTANQAKSSFLTSMTRDLRTPLNAIVGFSDIIRQNVLGAPEQDVYQQYAEDIHASGSLLISLIDDILEVSKIESGKYELAKDLIKIQSVIDASIEKVQILPETQRIVFEKRVSVPVNAHFVGDSRALGQMLVNILSNAVKYSPADSTIYIAAELDDTGAMRLRFRDEGTGMTEAEIQRAAEPFERGQAGDAVKQKGTGLGLYLCAKVMMLFGGTLKIDSAEGKGTTVTLTFPPSRTILPKTVATFPPPDLPEQPTPRP